MRNGMKKWICLCLVFCMVFSASAVPVRAEQAAAQDHDLCLLEKVEHKTSVPAGYIGIYSVADLKALQGSDKKANYILMNSLDITDKQWNPLKFEHDSDYAGVFDGNGYTIRFVNIETDSHVGLFYGNEGTIKNLRISGKISISSELLGQRMAASVVLENVGTIYNCTSSVDFFNADGLVVVIGGIVATNSGTVSHCRFTGSMRTTDKGFADFGGIVYYNTSHWMDYYKQHDWIGRIEYCECNASLSAFLGNEEGFPVYVNSVEVNIGGIVATQEMETFVSTCRYTGNIYVAGWIADGEINVGGIAGDSSAAGGIEIDNCSFTGKIRFNCEYNKWQPNFHTGGICGVGSSDSLKQCFVSGEILDEGMILGAPGWFFGTYSTVDEGDKNANNYYPSGSLDLYGFGGNSTMDAYFTAVPLAAMAQQSTFAGFDFGTIWSMGQSYPIQKVFLNLYPDDGDPTPEPEPVDEEMDEEEYVLQHLAFIHSYEYETRSALRFSVLMEDCMDSPDQETAETAYKILNTINETTKFKKWSIFDNQYEAVVAELITRSAMEEIDSIDLKLESQSLTISKHIWTLLKNTYPGKYTGKEYETSIQKFLKDPVMLEEESPGIYNELKGAMDDYFLNGQDKADALRAISQTTALYGKMNDFIAVANNCASVVEWISDLHSFQCTVEALYSLSQEQLEVFRLMEDSIRENVGEKEAALFKAAYQKFDNYLTREHIAAAVFEEGVMRFGELTLDLLNPLISTVMTDYLVQTLGLSSELAGKISILIAGYQAGWAIGTSLTNNDKIMADCDLLHANAAIEEALYAMTKEREAALESQKTYATAKEFDAAWMLLRVSEQYAVSIYKDMLSSMQSSIKSKFLTLGRVDIYGNSRADEITLANYEYIKWDNAICHGQKMHEKIEGERDRINNVNLSGVADFCLSTLSGLILVEVCDGEICANTPSLTVRADENGYTVSMSGDLELLLEIFEGGSASGSVEIVTVDENGVEISRSSLEDVDMTGGISLEITQYGDEAADVAPEDDDMPCIELMPAECSLVAGDTRTLDAVPAPGCEVGTLTWWSDDPEIVSVDRSGRIRGLKAGSTFINVSTEAEDGLGFCLVHCLFRDVTNEEQYFFEPVYWALDEGITTGTSDTTFTPNGKCLRYQFVLFLWRLAGRPAPRSGYCPFVDVKRGDSCYDAVLWAYENGVTTGTDPTHFSPKAELSRGQVCTFLYRYAGAPAVSGTTPFVDVAEGRYYADAVKWALRAGVTTGMDDTHFRPDYACTRGQTVTFIYRLDQAD